MKEYPSNGTATLEEWLVDVCNGRGAKVITRSLPDLQKGERYPSPPLDRFSNAELIVACFQPNCIDHPQLLRPAAQLISRGDVDLKTLLLMATRERSDRVMAEIARQALKVDSQHTLWLAIHDALDGTQPLRDTIIHWTRLAEPVMEKGKPNAQGWRLVA